MSTTVERLAQEFVSTLEVEGWEVPPDLRAAAEAALQGCRDWPIRKTAVRRAGLLALVNSKLRLNRSHLHAFLDGAAAHRIVLNYHDKADVQECFDNCDGERLRQLLEPRGHWAMLADLFRPIPPEETLAGLHEQLRTGAVTRKDARACDVSERKNEVLRSLFGSFIFSVYPVEAMHRHFNQDSRTEYLSDFYQHLLRFHAGALRRDCALVFLNIDQTLREAYGAAELRDALFSFIQATYLRLSNHCFFGILIKPFTVAGESGHWRLFSDLVLFAEKHREVRLAGGYFRPDAIEASTVAHIPQIDREAAAFHTTNEGFFFRDCFVVVPGDPGAEPLTTTSADVTLLLLFEKNERDETLIPCPACRSTAVAGNSYPVLGVRSWECQNSICPERSAFDRGNRYSLSALIKQEAIKSDADQIPESSLRKWKLDVLRDGDERSVARMLLMHFSLHGDTVVVVNAGSLQIPNLGRRIMHEAFAPQCERGIAERFEQSAYFRRFVVDRGPVLVAQIEQRRFPTPIPGVALYEGDCFEVLGSMPEATIDGAVTSPPYYNARSYAVWSNIYCYLYDMYNSARQVFRVLKPGAFYLFNIFDYFDNENNIVSSAMGKKRMILGAYVVNLFRRVGFRLKGNVVWYKGEIEGKRNFNQGNRSPYYQFPFNCWEHVLVFEKPAALPVRVELPTVLDAKPVVKMVRGENVHGHSAPFPEEIPGLLLAQMGRRQVVLDPFAGSLTTARAAHARGISSVSIELHHEYCELGVRLLQRERGQLELFAAGPERSEVR